MDETEAFVAGIFLRRYVTYCARLGRYSQMNVAARLLRSVTSKAFNKCFEGRGRINEFL